MKNWQKATTGAELKENENNKTVEQS